MFRQNRSIHGPVKPAAGPRLAQADPAAEQAILADFDGPRRFLGLGSQSNGLWYHRLVSSPAASSTRSARAKSASITTRRRGMAPIEPSMTLV